MPKLKAFVGLGLCLVTLGGCSKESRQFMGFERTPPDQSAIITNPPLIMPPNYDLRPPRQNDAGAAANAEKDAGKDAGKTANDTRNILLKGKSGENGADNSDNAPKDKK